MTFAQGSTRVWALLVSAACLLLSCGPVAVEGKSVSGKFRLEAGDFDHGPEYEITKFSFAIGKGSVTGKFTYDDPKTWMTSPALYLFMDEVWDKYHEAPACVDKVAFAHASIPIGKKTASHQHIASHGLGKATHSALKKLDDGKVEWEFTWEVDHDTRTAGWFVIAADCALEQYNAQVPPMQFEIHLLNPGNTHLPADEYGLPKLYLFTFVAMGIYLAYLLKMLKEHYEETHKIHLVVQLLLTAYICQGVSLGFELSHLEVYKHNGYGVHIFDLASEIFEGLSQTVISFVLICLASGWTLIETSADDSRANSVATILRNPGNMLKGPNVVVLVVIALVVSSMLLQIANKGYDDDFQKFHNHESTPGRILVGIRFLLGVAFIVSLFLTIRSQEKRGGERLVMFLRRLMVMGGLWFLSFPLIVGCAGFLTHYNRHAFVTAGTLLLQTASLGTLGHQFMSHHSTYFRISTLADAGALPGAGGLVRAPKMSRD
mmetsp:Transcript_4104/g.8858  ORF Transcript_4104/g.8858 Transcript_4104/m.8858 type:complete len:489 (-) Transcript_4104:327-1793(-)